MSEMRDSIEKKIKSFGNYDFIEKEKKSLIELESFMKLNWTALHLSFSLCFYIFYFFFFANDALNEIIAFHNYLNFPLFAFKYNFVLFLPILIVNFIVSYRIFFVLFDFKNSIKCFGFVIISTILFSFFNATVAVFTFLCYCYLLFCFKTVNGKNYHRYKFTKNITSKLNKALDADTNKIEKKSKQTVFQL